MPSKDQIKCIQIAVRTAGLRDGKNDGRYRMLLSNYKQSSGRPVTSCKQLNDSQITDLLAICESLGWRMPGQPDDCFRRKVDKTVYGAGTASFAQQSAIDKLKGDLGWGSEQLAGMIKRMTKDRVGNVSMITSREAHGVIEALKNMYSRKTGKEYANLNEVKEDVEAAKDGKANQVG